MLDIVIAPAALLGGILAIVFIERAFHRSRQGVHFRSWCGSTSGLRRSHVQPSPEETAELFGHLDHLTEIQRSRLSRVIGVGAVLNEFGITVEFLSIELREAGGRATYRVHADVAYRGQGDRSSPWRIPLQPSVIDDAGTQYTTGMGSWGGSAAGEDYSEFVVDFVFTPAPPASATSLRVSVPYLDPTGGPPDPYHLPWVFDVPL